MDWEVAGKDNSGSNSSPTLPNRKGKKLKKWVVVVVILVAIVAFANVQSCMRNQPKTLNWPTSGLATLLPDPPTKRGEIIYDDDDQFMANVAECSEGQYEEYVESCTDKGFTTDAESTSSTYEAFSNEGYKLRLDYSSSDEELSIYLNAPVEMNTLVWPTTGAGSNAPAPSSSKGRIDSDSSSIFVAYVGDTDITVYGAYVDACIAAGYSIDYQKGDKSFYADRADGAHITVSYEGFNTMKVAVNLENVNKDSEETDGKSANETSESASEDTSNSGDFRQFVDDYEAFMNKYCDFMEKYNSSSDTASMMAEYATLTKEYADWTARYDDYDTDSLSDDDLAYYAAANTRVAERLAKIQ